jgi:hypothetical protein
MMSALQDWSESQNERLKEVTNAILGAVDSKLKNTLNAHAKKHTPKPDIQIQQSRDDDDHSDTNEFPSGMPPSLSHLMDFFPWVEQAQVKKIVTGKFNINDLPKLFRDPDARQKNLEDTVHGIITDVPSGKQKFLVTDGKMHTAFPTLQTFISAFSVYTEIRCAYAPEYGCALAS